MAKRITIRDHKDASTHFVLDGTTAAGWVECVCATEWKAFRADGSFVEWFGSKAAAVRAI